VDGSRRDGQLLARTQEVNNMQVRTLDYDDLDSLLGLYEHLFETDAPLPGREEVIRVWRSIIENPMLRCLGLELDGKLLSSCTLTITPNLTRGARPYGQIENVVTHTEYRRRGFGQALIQRALSIAWDHRCYKVMLMTGRLDVHDFYQECGFRKDVKTGFVAYPPM
jgi:GNAT superfamily N-acetyltransferase